MNSSLYYDYSGEYSGSGGYENYNFSYGETNQSMIVGAGYVPSRIEEISPGPNGTTINSSILCGFPSFCSESAYTKCANVTLLLCDGCSSAVAFTLVIFSAIFGLVVCFGNGLVILHSMKEIKKDNKLNLIKASLAVSDIFVGIQLLVIVSYNFAWSVNSTSHELDSRQLAYNDSPAAMIGGIFYMTGFTSSLFHLLFLSIERFIAITYPLKYKFQSQMVLRFVITFMWVLAILSASLPAFFPSQFVYTYSHILFLFYPSARSYNGSGITATAIALFVLFYLFPFILMTILSVITGFSIKRRMANSRNIGSGNKLKLKEKEYSAYKTIALMQIGFTLTLVPMLVVIFLFYGNVLLNCNNFSTPYITCFYCTMVNSLVNFLLYSLREAKFRSTMKNVLCCGRNPVYLFTSSRQYSSQTQSTVA